MVETLVRNAGRLVTARQLLQEVWGPQYTDESGYIRVHLAHVRRKLEPEPVAAALLPHRAGDGLPLRVRPGSLIHAHGPCTSTPAGRGWSR